MAVAVAELKILPARFSPSTSLVGEIRLVRGSV